jgi:DNA-binding response OmpR family regulator
MAYIIVADDDDIVGDLVCSALIDAGHSAGYLTNGRDALATIRQRRPDLLILDCNMPELSGLLLLRELRNSVELCDLPVLILSGRRSDADVELAHFEGADDYMKKPFDAEEVVFRVEELLAKHRRPPAPSPRRPAACGFGKRRA